jgi:hypothetical protein
MSDTLVYRYAGYWLNIEDAPMAEDDSDPAAGSVLWKSADGKPRVFVSSGLGASVTACASVLPVLSETPDLSVHQMITVQSSGGRRTCVVDATADDRWLAARGLFPRVGHLGTTRPNHSKAHVVYYTRCVLDLMTKLREECSPSQDSMQRVFTGVHMPDHRVFNEMFLQYQVLQHDAPTAYAAR